jgi:hypothetical protein
MLFNDNLFFLAILYSLLYDITFIWFLSDVWEFTLTNSIFLDWFLLLLIVYLFHLFLLLLWRFVYRKFNFKKERYCNIYVLAFVLRIFPILSIIWSFLLWMNKEKLSKIILIFTAWFILYTIIWYIIFKYYFISWWNLF